MIGQILLLSAASMAGGLIQGTCGFGCGILAMLGFSFVLPVNQAAAVTSVINFGVTFPTMLRYRKHLTIRKIVIPFLVYTVTSILIIRVSMNLDAKLLKRIFGGFLLALSIYHFTFSGKQPTNWTPALSAMAFIISGLGSGLFAVGGPLMVLYFLGHTDRTEEYLADTQMIFVINAAPTLFMRIRNGLLTTEHIPYLIPGLTGVLIGFLLAGKIVGKIDKPKLTKLVYTAVGISGFLYLMGL